MKRLHLLLMFIILMNSTHIFSQPIDPQNITMEVKLRQDTVLLGQPFFIYLVFTNHSNETVTLQKKPTFQKSKDEFLIISPDNDTIQMPEVDLDKVISTRRNVIFPGASLAFPIMVGKNANIKATGTYTGAFSFSSDFIIENHVGTYPINAHRQWKTTFTVLEDDPKLGLFIDHVASKVINPIWYYLEQQDSYEYRMLFEDIDDKRIIPHLARAAKLPKIFPLDKTLDLISRYSLDSLAFSVLKEAAKGPDDTYCAIISDDSIQVNWEKTGNRQKAIKYIMARNNQQALDFIGTLNNQDVPCERYGILLNASQYFSAENAQKLYAFYLNDGHPAIRKKARELFKNSNFGKN